MAIDATQKLSIYNRALGAMGERKLASVTEAREPRRVLDDYFTNAVYRCLESGNWKFAHRSAELNDRSGAPAFGFTKNFIIPVDLVRISRISESADLEIPLLSYREENGSWYTNTSPIYVEYVSSHSSLGGLDGSKWPQLFEDYVIASLARLAAPRITGLTSTSGPDGAPKADWLERQEGIALSRALEHNSVAEAPAPDIVRHCLEQAAWKFAVRTISRAPDVDNAPTFGFANAFVKPTDWVRTVSISDNAFLNPPLTRLNEEKGFWQADVDVLFVRYVSNGVDYGLNRATWPQSFKDYVEAHAAVVQYVKAILDGTAEQAQQGQSSPLQALQQLEAVALARALEHNSRGESAPADVVRYCLEKALWRFALKIAEIAKSNTETPSFGFQRAFAKPTDWVASVNISDNECLEPPLLRFSEQKGFWHADCESLFVRYVSNHDDYGSDQSKWPQTFKDYVEAHERRVTYARSLEAKADTLVALMQMEKRALGEAREKDAIATPPQFPASGTWVRSRMSGVNRSRWDRRS